MMQDPGGGGVLPCKTNGDVPVDGVAFSRLVDYNEIAFSIELLEVGRIFSDFGG